MKNMLCLVLGVGISSSLFAMTESGEEKVLPGVVQSFLGLADDSLDTLILFLFNPLDQENQDIQSFVATSKSLRDITYQRSGGGIADEKNFTALCASLEYNDPHLHRAAALGPERWARVYNPDRSLVMERDRKGSFPLHYAAACGNFRAVADIINENVDINGDKRIYAAIRNGDDKELKALLEAGVSPLGASNLYGETSYGFASVLGHRDVRKVLIEYCAERFSPMHVAAQLGKIIALRLLAAHRAPIDIFDYQGKTVLESAKNPETRAAIEELLLAERMQNLAL